MTRVRRKLIACCTASLLIFAQLAVAGYVCPNHGQSKDVMQSAEVVMAEMPCHDSAAENPNLCKQYCDHAAQSVDNRVQAKAAVALPPPMHLAIPLAIGLLEKHRPPTENAQYCAKPPLYIHNCSFLI